MQPHELAQLLHRQKGLFEGVNATTVGGPFVDVPAAAESGVGLAGQGAAVSLVKFNPDIALTGPHGHHPPAAAQQKIGPEPSVLTCSVAVKGQVGLGQPPTGPLVGIVRYGSGNGGQQEVEFDLQLGFPLFTVPAPAGSVQPAGGAILTVPATSLEVLARNDANVIPFNGDTTLGAGNGTNPQASASIALGQRTSTAQLTRTLYTVYEPAVPKAAGTFVIPVAARAVSFRIFRGGGGVLTVLIMDQQNNEIDGFTIAAGAVAPEVLLPAWSSNIVVQAAANINVLGAVYKLAL